MTKDDALKMALGALESIEWHGGGWGLDPDLIETSITAIKEVLAQPAQEPVAWLCSPDENGLFDLPLTHKACKDCFPVYTTPPQRPWVGLTEQERNHLENYCEMIVGKAAFDAIENALRIKNT
jgi:hypothetical protein